MGKSSAKKIKCSDLEDWFDDVFIVHEDKVPLSVAVEKEVPTFLGSTKCAKDRDTTLLQWWHNEFIFPRLATLARKVFLPPLCPVKGYLACVEI